MCRTLCGGRRERRRKPPPADHCSNPAGPEFGFAPPRRSQGTVADRCRNKPRELEIPGRPAAWSRLEETARYCTILDELFAKSLVRLLEHRNGSSESSAELRSSRLIPVDKRRERNAPRSRRARNNC